MFQQYFVKFHNMSIYLCGMYNGLLYQLRGKSSIRQRINNEVYIHTELPNTMYTIFPLQAYINNTWHIRKMSDIIPSPAPLTDNTLTGFGCCGIVSTDKRLAICCASRRFLADACVCAWKVALTCCTGTVRWTVVNLHM